MNRRDFASVLGVLCVGLAMIATQSISGRDRNVTAKVQYGATKLPAVPAEGAYTIGTLLDLINTNNPAGTSNFLVVTDSNNRAVRAADMSDLSHVAGSASVVRAGIVDSAWAKDADVRATRVELRHDAALADYLVTGGRVRSADAGRYSQLLGYFEYQGYRFYLNDPYPAREAGKVYPAGNIIKKWDAASFQ